MLCLYLFAAIQIVAWKKSFNNKWNSDAQKQLNQMKLSAIEYMSIFLLTCTFDFVSITGRRNLMKMWRMIGWKGFLVIIVISLCFSNVFVIFVWRSKAAEIFVEFTLQVSLFHLNFNVFLLLHSHRMNMHCQNHQVHCCTLNVYV
jgi:uncharacterized membrane protein